MGIQTVRAALIVASLVASRRKKRKPGAIDTSKPPTLTERGSPVPFLIGSDRLPGMLLWSFEDKVVFEDLEGGASGKGIGSGPGGKNEVIYALGQTAFVVGPGRRLMRLTQDGRKIWPKPGEYPDGITPATAPSGSIEFQCRSLDNGGSEGTFRWYWGEIDQPIDAVLSNARKGAVTNDGFMCFAVWERKRLGGTNTWPTLEADLQVQPYSPLMLYNGGASWDPDTVASAASNDLTGSDSWIEGYRTADPDKLASILTAVNAASSTTVRVCGDVTADFPVDTLAELSNTNGDGRYYVTDSTYIPGAGTVFDDSTLREVEGTRSFYLSIQNGDSSKDPQIGVPLVVPAMPALPGETGNERVVPNMIVADGDVTIVNGSVRYRPNESGPYIPPPGNSGHLIGQGSHQISIYIYRGDFRDFTMWMGFDVSLGGTYEVEINKASGVAGAISTGTSDAELTTSLTVIDANYTLVSVRLTVPATDVGKFYDHTFRFSETTDLLNFKFLACEDSAVSEPMITHSPYQPCTGGATDIELEPVSGTLADFDGSIAPVTLNSEVVAGANFAHVLNQLVSYPAPHGLGDLTAYVDVPSLVTLGQLLETEEVRSHYLLASGNRHAAILERAMYELLINAQWDCVTGLWRFEALRSRAADYAIHEDMILSGDLGEKGVVLSATPKSVLFKFRNMERNLTSDPISYDESGISTNELSSALQKIELDTVRDYQTAVSLSSRLYLLESSGILVRELPLNRDAETMRVGDFVDTVNLFGVPEPLMVKELAPRCLDPITDVVLASTPFSEQTQALPLTQQLPNNGPQAVTRDMSQSLFKLSTYVSDSPTYLMLRVPGNGPTSKSLAMVSRDGVAYRQRGTISPVTGGYIVASSVAEPTLRDQFGQYDFVGGPGTIEANGPKIRVFDDSFADNVRTLTDAELQAGEQWLVVGQEVMFVRRFDPVVTGVWQAVDIIRARFDHGIDPLIADTPAYVVHSDALPRLSIDVTADDTPYAKMVEIRQEESTPLADAPAIAIPSPDATVQPPYLGETEVTNASGGWHDTYDLELSWPFANPRLYGFSRYSGLPIQGTEAFDGLFRVEIWSGPAETDVKLTSVLGGSDGTVAIPGTDIETARTTAGLPATGQIRIRVLAFSHAGVLADQPADTVVDYEVP